MVCADQEEEKIVSAYGDDKMTDGWECFDKENMSINSNKNQKVTYNEKENFIAPSKVSIGRMLVQKMMTGQKSKFAEAAETKMKKRDMKKCPLQPVKNENDMIFCFEYEEKGSNFDLNNDNNRTQQQES